MLKSLLTKGLIVAVLVTLGLTQSSAQVFWSETFSDQASSTANWANGGTNDGPLSWVWTNDPDAGAWNGPWAAPTAATGYMWFDSDANGEFAHNVTLTGPAMPISCAGKTDVRLKLNTFFRTFDASDVAKVGISTDGVNFTYHNVPELDALAGEASYDGAIEIDINEADNQPTVWIQFSYEGFYQYYWKVDDITLEEYQVPTYDVTFRVNSSLITPDPAGMKIAGTFTNWADANMVNDGNGVWSYTANFTAGEVLQYKFKNGPGGWEAGNAACGVNDGNGGFNRSLTVTQTVTLAAVCFNSCTPCQVVCETNPDAIICDKFDSYSTALKLGPQATWWSTWSGTEGTTEDGIVTTEQAFSAPNSFKVVSTAAAGGPQDVVLNLGNKTTGHYDLNWKMFIPTGKAGYYNIQNIVPIAAGDWNLDVFFDVAGTGHIQIGAGAQLATFTHPKGAWFDVKHRFDLDNNLMTLWINGVLVKKMAFAKNLGGIDFYGTDATHQFYVDNVEYIKLPSVVYNADLCDAAVDITGSLGQVSGVVSTAGPFDITNATLDPINDPTTGFECHFNGDPLQGNHWFTFVGDGNTYSITSADCGSTPIADGDTQFALYTGSCGDYTAVDCNDDIDGASDLHSRLIIATEPGVTYYLMVDSYNGLNGTYCLDIEQFASIDCSQGVVGLNAVSNDGVICFGGNLTDVMDVDASSYVVPNVGPVGGHLWCITTEPLDPNVWPGTISGIASTTASADVILVNLPNDGSAFPPGVYYLTSVLVGAGTLIDPAGLARVFNIDVTDGCFFIGESHQVILVPELTDLVAFESYEVLGTGNLNIELSVAGGFAEAVGDPSLYNYLWSNGATTASLSNVPNAVYTVTISDPTGCVSEIVINTTVGTSDPSTVKSLNITPNPTTGLVNLNLSLATAADVQIEVINTLGQTVQTIQAGKTTAVIQAIDLSTSASGSYMVRVRMDNETAIRRIVVQH